MTARAKSLHGGVTYLVLRPLVRMDYGVIGQMQSESGGRPDVTVIRGRQLA